MIERLAALVAERPGRLLLALGVVTVAFALAAPRLTIDSAMDTIFQADDPELAIYDEFKRTFGEDEIVVVGLRDPDGDVFDPETLARIHRISQAIQALPPELGVARVVSLTTVDAIRPTEDGFEVGPLVADPATLTATAAAAARRAAFANPLYARNLVSEDGDATAVNVGLVHRPGDRTYKERLFRRVRAIAEAERGSLEAYYAGIPVLTVYTSEWLRDDMLVFIPLTIAAIALVLLLTFRSVAGVVLPLATVGVAVVWTLGFVVLIGRSISILSSIVPSLLIAIGVAYTVHVLGQYLQDGGRLRDTMRHVALPVVLSGLTTTIGFGSLAAADIVQVREFGLFTAFGVVAATLLALLGVPAVLGLRPVRRAAPRAEGAGRDRVHRAMVQLGPAVLRHRRVTLLGAALLTAFSAWGISRLRVDTDYSANFAPGTAPVRGLQFMREELSGERPVNVVLTAAPEAAGPEPMLEPENLRRIEAIEARLRAHPLVGATLSVAGYLRNLEAAMRGVPLAEGRLPTSGDAAAQLLLLYGRPQELRRFLSPDGRAAAILGRSSIISSREFLDLADRLRTESAAELGDAVRVTVTGSMYHLSKASIAVSVGQAKSLAVASALILGIMIVLFRSVRIGLLATVPNALPIALNFALMGVLGVTLNTGTSVMAAMALGVAVDDTIHFLTRYRALRRDHPAEEAVQRTLATAGRHIVATSVTNFCGFGVLTLSSFVPLVALGWLTALTMATALVADLVLLPALLVTFDRAAPG